MKKLKHNHTLTDFLKFGIFAILLLMPILIFVPNAFYYGFNEHAVAQEKTEQVPVYYETNVVTDANSIHLNYVYTFTDNVIVESYSQSYYLFDVTILRGNYINESGRVQLGNNGHFYINIKSQYYDMNTQSFDLLITRILNDLFDVPSKTFNYFAPCQQQYFSGEYTPVTTSMSITDSMSYAWDSVWQNDLFSWTSNNSIYTVINNMNTTLGIPAAARLADYLTYITLFTVIYVIIDIIIGTFTMLTHLFNKEPK